MVVLGIETAQDICGVAFADENGLVAEKNVHGKNTHSELIFGLIEELLKKSGVNFKSIKGIAVSIGPGSYTGLRIGLSAAKGLAYGLNIPLAGIPTLDSLAMQYKNAGETVWSVLPFRRDELYACRYIITETGANKDSDYMIYSAEEFINTLSKYKKNIVIGRMKENVFNKFQEHSFITIFPSDKISLRSGVIAELGIKRFQSNDTDNLFNLEPMYLRGFPV